MKLLKELKPNAFKEYQRILLNASKCKVIQSKELDIIVNKFIEGYFTTDEREMVNEYTSQISYLVDKIKNEKKAMIFEIDISCLLSSSLQSFCKERAVLYLISIERIRKEYGEQLATFLTKYKNLQ